MRPDGELPLELGEMTDWPEPVDDGTARPEETERDAQEVAEAIRAEQADRERIALEHRERQLANLRPGEAPLRHGVYAELGVYLLCEACPTQERCDSREEGGHCRLEERYIAERMAQVLSEPHLTPARDSAAVELLAWTEVRIKRARSYLAMVGEIDASRSEYRGVAKDLASLVNMQGRMLRDLSLTPATAKALAEEGRAPEGAYARLILVFEQPKAEAEVIEGEFTAEEASPPTPSPEGEGGTAAWGPEASPPAPSPEGRGGDGGVGPGGLAPCPLS